MTSPLGEGVGLGRGGGGSEQFRAAVHWVLGRSQKPKRTAVF